MRGISDFGNNEITDSVISGFLGNVLLWVALAWIVGIFYSIVDKIVSPNVAQLSGEGNSAYRLNSFKAFTRISSFADVIWLLIIMLLYPIVLLYLAGGLGFIMTQDPSI